MAMGVIEVLIVLVFGLLVLFAVAFLLLSTRRTTSEQVPSYNELKVDNKRLRAENAQLREENEERNRVAKE